MFLSKIVLLLKIFSETDIFWEVSLIAPIDSYSIFIQFLKLFLYYYFIIKLFNHSFF